MSYLTENPDLMLEALAVLVKRLGGYVEISASDAPGPFNLLSKFDPSGKLYLMYEQCEAEGLGISSDQKYNQ